MKKAAIICANGLGDALLMMIVAHQLKQAGYAPTLFHNHEKELSPLFKEISIRPHPPIHEIEETLVPFGQIIVQNDHSERAHHLFSLRKLKKCPRLIGFFPTPSHEYKEGDFLFHQKRPFATNLRQGCQKNLGLKEATKENGIQIPKGKTHRKLAKRIVLHPTSQDPKRNWSQRQFLLLARLLKKEGYLVSFAVSPKEHSNWTSIKNEGFELPLFPLLSDLASYIYESGFFIGNDSGIGHLASNLCIPTLTISGNPKRVSLWRPDWCAGYVVTLPFPLPNFKGIHFRFRENFWQHFVSVSRVLNTFHKLKAL